MTKWEYIGGKMDKVKISLKKIGQGISKKITKVSDNYNNMCEKNPRKGTIVTIGVTCGIAFLIMAGAKMATTEDTTSIATNKAEEAYFKSDYENAITEYNNLQLEEEWPVWQVKAAEVHSLKGEFAKSNSLLEDAFEKRSKLIDRYGYGEYVDKDIELAKNIVFTSLMNGEYGKALEYGELMLKDNSANKQLYGTMITVYVLNDKREEANKLIKNYPVDDKSSHDMAIAAYLNIMIDNWDKGFELLKKSFDKNKDEIKVLDVISQTAVYNNDELLRRLIELSEKNPEEVAYKIWIAKVYSMLPESSPQAAEILDSIDTEKVGKTTYKMIKAKVLQNTGDEEGASELIDEIIKEEKNSFLGYHVAAWNAYEKGNYKKAFEYCEKSIIEDKSYADNYGFLIPEILMKEKQENEAEPYFRTAIYKEPFNYNIMLKIADYYWVTNENLENAYYYMNLASKLRPKDAEIIYKMGLIQISSGKVEEAEANFKKAIEVDGGNPKYSRTLGTLYLNQNKREEGIKAIRDAYAIDKDDPKTLNNAGVYYLSEGEVARAYENLKSSYEKINDGMDKETKDAITSNYLKCKEVYDIYIQNDGANITVPDLTLFY